MKGASKVIWIIVGVVIFTITFLFISILTGYIPWLLGGFTERINELFGLPLKDMILLLHLDDVTLEEKGEELLDAANRGNKVVLGDSVPSWEVSNEKNPFSDKVMFGASALRFNGTGGEFDYVNVTNDENPEIFNPNSISIDLWLYLLKDPDCDNNRNTNNWRYIVVHSDEMNAGYRLILEQEYNGVKRAINFRFYVGDEERIISSKTPLKVGEYSHIVATYDNRTGVARIYINGRLDVEKKFSPGNIKPYHSNVLRIGGYNTQCSGSEGWGSPDAVLDEIRIYSRALRPSEVVMHYQGIY